MTKQKMISRTYDLIRSHEENAKRAEKKYLRPDTDDGTNYGIEALVERGIAMALRSLYLEFQGSGFAEGHETFVEEKNDKTFCNICNRAFNMGSNHGYRGRGDFILKEEDMKTIEDFRRRVEWDGIMRLEKEGRCNASTIAQRRAYIKLGIKYMKVDVGDSGRFMVDVEGNIFGIRSYGRINKQKHYGNLQTTDLYSWGGYIPKLK